MSQAGDESFVQKKMKAIKRAKSAGRDNEAERHARQLLDYLGIE